MAESEYEQWWQLHLRVASGETLGSEEEIAYRAGLELLEREEATQLSLSDVTLLRSLRARLQTLVHLQNSLLLQSAKLDEKIEELERTYQQLTGLDLAVDVYAIR
ncbi:MAG: hypothetical protein DYG89_28375 [Caldilinea sp. CFX5]|nr:hypothetical protein [Caldilinea sp. CFX5]